MNKYSKTEIQNKIKDGSLSPSEVVRLLAKKSGEHNMWRLSLRIDYPDRYPEYSYEKNREK